MSKTAHFDIKQQICSKCNQPSKQIYRCNCLPAKLVCINCWTKSNFSICSNCSNKYKRYDQKSVVRQEMILPRLDSQKSQKALYNQTYSGPSVQSKIYQKVNHSKQKPGKNSSNNYGSQNRQDKKNGSYFKIDQQKISVHLSSQNTKKNNPNYPNGYQFKSRIQSQRFYDNNQVHYNQVQSQTQNYPKQFREKPTQLTRKEQISLIKKQIQKQKGYIHQKCGKIYKLYDLAKLIDQTEKQLITFKYCTCKSEKSFIIELLKDQCLVCAKNKEIQTSKYKLKNGFCVCDGCKTYIDRQIDDVKQYIKPLFFECVSCETSDPIKRSKSQMEIETLQDLNYPMYCKICFKMAKRSLIKADKKQKNIKKCQKCKKQFYCIGQAKDKDIICQECKIRDKMIRLNSQIISQKLEQNSLIQFQQKIQERQIRNFQKSSTSSNLLNSYLHGTTPADDSISQKSVNSLTDIYGDYNQSKVRQAEGIGSSFGNYTQMQKQANRLRNEENYLVNFSRVQFNNENQDSSVSQKDSFLHLQNNEQNNVNGTEFNLLKENISIGVDHDHQITSNNLIHHHQRLPSSYQQQQPQQQEQIDLFPQHRERQQLSQKHQQQQKQLSKNEDHQKARISDQYFEHQQMASDNDCPISNQKLQVQFEQKQTERLETCYQCRILLNCSHGVIIQSNCTVLFNQTLHQLPQKNYSFMCITCYYDHYKQTLQAEKQLKRSPISKQKQSIQTPTRNPKNFQTQDKKSTTSSSSKRQSSLKKTSTYKQKAIDPSPKIQNKTLKLGNNLSNQKVSQNSPKKKKPNYLDLNADHDMKNLIQTKLNPKKDSLISSNPKKVQQKTPQNSNKVKQKTSENCNKVQQKTPQNNKTEQVRNPEKQIIKQSQQQKPATRQKKATCLMCDQETKLLCFGKYCLQCFRIKD